MIVVNISLNKLQNERIPNTALVTINRMYREAMEGKTISSLQKEGVTMKLVSEKELQLSSFLNQSQYSIVLLPAQEQGMFYWFAYEQARIPQWLILLVNIIFCFIIVFILYLYCYIRKQVIQPFHQMKALAQALKNRDFTYQLPQQKARLFGDFIWAIDVMREELRAHEETEVQLLKEKKLMIASVSHDIKTPLSNIRLYTDALQESLYPQEIIQARIYENCEKINQYINEIMAANQEDLFDFSVHMEEIYMEEVLAILKREAERVKLAFVSYEQEECANELIYTDMIRLREVLSNVIDNALKYGDGNWIHISFYEEDQHQVIAIANSGENIDLHDISLLYQSFYRGRNVTSQKGNGLGLYICKQLMKEMQGDIFMTQKQGSVCFHLVLGTL